MDVALTRTDGTTAEGYGEIGRLLLKFKHLPPDSPLPAWLFSSNVLTISPDEKLTALNAGRTDFFILEQENVGTAALPDFQNSVRLAPNPASSFIRLESPLADIRRVEISAADGTLLRVLEPGNAVSQLDVSLQNLPVAAYFARIFTENGVVLKKFVTAR